MTGNVNADARPQGGHEHPDQPELFDRLLTTAEKKAMAREIRQRCAALRRQVANCNKALLTAQRELAAHLETLRLNNRESIKQTRKAINMAASELIEQTGAMGLTIEGKRALLTKLSMLSGLMISASRLPVVPLRELIYVAGKTFILQAADSPTGLEALAEVAAFAIAGAPDQLRGQAEAWFQTSLTNHLAGLDPLGCEPSPVSAKEVLQ
jgi:hypothetical protein